MIEFEKLDDSTDLINGSHLQGYVTTTYDRLIEVFGQPSGDGDGYKVQVEWILKFEDGTIATIYDWKEDYKPQLVTEWHIGGFTKRAADLVKEVLS